MLRNSIINIYVLDFWLKIKIGTVMPYGSKIFHEYSYAYWKDNCTDNTVKQQNWGALMCTGRVLEEGKMNY